MTLPPLSPEMSNTRHTYIDAEPPFDHCDICDLPPDAMVHEHGMLHTAYPWYQMLLIVIALTLGIISLITLVLFLDDRNARRVQNAEKFCELAAQQPNVDNRAFEKANGCKITQPFTISPGPVYVTVAPGVTPPKGGLTTPGKVPNQSSGNTVQQSSTTPVPTPTIGPVIQNPNSPVVTIQPPAPAPVSAPTATSPRPSASPTSTSLVSLCLLNIHVLGAC